ncbi:hypothetical protein ADL19_19740 [Streptomyces purpurogeneiscleroticus]|jgi:hypothetical protein|nr:hypothetical protein ADL19_19740 [Streptomyces purpurogeneiscleroticus]
MANTPIPVASLPDPPRYAVESTDADFEILVVVPYNEGTVDEADRLAADRDAALKAEVEDDIAAAERRVRRRALAYSLIFGGI